MKTINKQWRRVAKCLALVTFALLSSFALADITLQDYSHRRHIIPGARSAMMGGAFTAISDDSSGLYFNPAGIVFGERKQEAIGILYSEFQQKSTYLNVIGEQPFHENSQSRFASISGGIFRKEAFSFGYSFLTLEQRSLNQDDQFPDLSQIGSNLTEFRRLHLENTNLTLVGAGGAYRFHPKMSLGFAAFHFQRRNELMDYQLSRNADGNLSSQLAKANTNNEGWIPNLGILYRDEKFGLGFSYQKVQSTSSQTNITTTSIEFQSPEESLQVDSSSTKSPSFREPSIHSYSFGAMLKPWTFLLISTDLLYHRADDHPLDLQDTLNYSAAVELNLTFLRFNYAFFTNYSLFPKVEDDQSNQTAHVNFLGQSYGISYISGPVDMSVAMIEQKGGGKAQIIADSYDIHTVESLTRQIFLAVTYRL